MEKHFKKHIEDDQHQLLIEARGGSIAGTGRSANSVGRNNAKGLLRVKLNNSDGRPATFSRVLAPGAGGITTQDRATSPFPVNMMSRPGQNGGNVATSASATSASPDRMTDTPSLRNESLAHESSSQQQQQHQHQPQQQQQQQQQQAATTYLNHHSHLSHHQQAAAAAASGPYQFVPFPHRPYAYDLLALGSMGQSMYGANKMVEHANNKYRDVLGKLDYI